MKNFYQYLINKLKNYRPFIELLDNYSSKNFPINLEGVKNSFASFILSELNSIDKVSFLIIVPYKKDAENLVEDLKKLDLDVYYFSDLEKMPYTQVNISSKIYGERQICYDALLNKEKAIVVATLTSFMQPVISPLYFLEKTIGLRVGENLEATSVSEKLIQIGYERVPRVSLEGEFALRGEVLDIFIPGVGCATRIFFEWDKIEKIRNFDSITQESFSNLEEITIFPVTEIFWDDDNIKNIDKFLGKKNYYKNFKDIFIDNLRETKKCDNEDLLFPLSFDKQYFLSDFMKDSDKLILINPERFLSVNENNLKKFKSYYNESRILNMLVPTPEEFLGKYENLFERFSDKIFLNYIKNINTCNRTVFDIIDSHSFFGNINYLKEELRNKIETGYKIHIFAGDELQKTRIEFILKEFDIEIYEKDIYEGFIIPPLKIYVLSDNEIFQRKHRSVTIERKLQTKTIDSFVELSEGDYIVHINHGVGIYVGIERVKTVGRERDYIKLEYRDGDIIFVPTEQVDLIQRYLGGDGKAPALDIVGGKSWANKRANAKKSVEDLADMLLDIYSDREEAGGFAFSQDSEWQYEFEAKFPYEETEDQLKAIIDVKSDMESSKPMDRLICGDAGNGKTEVAIRATFKAVVDGKQVAFICPTTILAMQHYDNFIQRYEKFPVRIELISRFVKKSEVKKILEDAKAGKVDILIGTHRLLQKDVMFDDLGLLVIDEEQRFGVKDKEKLKKLKVNVDCLSMSATPIPRTLHMALLKIRDVSLISTSPYSRKPIQTIIKKFDPALVREAILNEVEREGQVFYIHNRIETLEMVKKNLEEIVPEVIIETAHAGMAGSIIDDKMHRFIDNQFHVLISTTIVESGINIPNVNTIIIDRADMYGISQLYQLKGRVGRADKKSYAYLFYPEDSALSELASKRLQIISDYGELGSGFQIALKDMEIRGAGNLLGREQHGEISAVGYEMYVKLLEDTILKKNNKEVENEVFLELEYSGFIPDFYIEDKSEKMLLYKSIAKIRDENELDIIMAEITDKYGKIPAEVHSLFSISNIKIIAKKLFITSIKERNSLVNIIFGKLNILDVGKVVRLIGENRGIVQYNQKIPNQLTIKTALLNLEEKSAFICNILKNLL